MKKTNQEVIEMLVQEGLEVELLWKDVVQFPQSAHDGAALVAPRAKVTVHQRVVYGDLDLARPGLQKDSGIRYFG